MFKNKSQSGRSMVEMLGVLAIIGVLSIGGIAGYTMSMRRHRATQLVDSLNKYAMIVYSSCQKKIADGEITTSHYCDGPSYADLDLAPISELNYIGKGTINPLYPDIVTIGVNFSDLEICKTAKNIVGSKSDYDCTGNGSNGMEFWLKQN